MRKAASLLVSIVFIQMFLAWHSHVDAQGNIDQNPESLKTLKLTVQPTSITLPGRGQSSTPPASGAASNANPQSSDTVKYFSSAEVHAAFEKGSPLINKDGRTYWVTAGKRDKPGQSELHEKDTDVFYVLQGSATFVTGGKMLEPKTTAPGEMRGSGVEGGETHTLSKDDVIIIPAGVPHWFKDVQGTFLYFVVKVQ